jgi:hypothetical protein
MEEDTPGPSYIQSVYMLLLNLDPVLNKCYYGVVSAFDPQVIAGRAFEQWERLDRNGSWSMSLEDAEEWKALGLALWELKERLVWLGLYRAE